MKKFKKNITSYNDLIKGYYGVGNHLPGPKKSCIVTAKSFDNGETLIQTVGKTIVEEYVVQSSVTDIAFEEYVVEKVPTYTSSQASFEYMDQDTHKVGAAQETYIDIFNPVQPSVAASYTIPEPVAAETFIHQQSVTPPPSYPVSVENKYSQPESVTKKAAATDDDFMADLQAIFSGQKAYDPETKATVDRNAIQPSSAAAPPQSESSFFGNAPSADAQNNPPLPEAKNEHAIFDRIAQSMQYANAYDLGSIDIDKRLSDFDRIADFREAKKSTSSQQSAPVQGAQTVPVQSAPVSHTGNEEFIQDLDAIKGNQQPSQNQPQPIINEAAIKTEAVTVQ